jgi:PAS domain S-box-containing protein
MNVQSLKDISLKWKLLIPFLFISFFGTTCLVLIAFNSQNALIENQEKKALYDYHRFFRKLIDEKRDYALSLASMIANDPHVQEAFSRRDREALLSHLIHSYKILKDKFGITQLHFHIPPARSFLRLHKPESFGDSMESYRKTISEVERSGEATGGLEKGATGFAIRSVVPVVFNGKQIGTIEVGFSFGRPLLLSFKEKYGCNIALFIPLSGMGHNEEPSIIASTFTTNLKISKEEFHQVLKMGRVLIYNRIVGEDDLALLLGPVKDFSGKIVSVVAMGIDRRPTLTLIKSYKSAMLIVEAVALLLAFSFVGFISLLFIRPISEIVRTAKEIAEGKRVTVPIRTSDEIGILARALNNMVLYLESSRQRLKEHAEELEKEVMERTRDLLESERMYRTLVENLPLVVYRMKADRTPIFLNPFFEKILDMRMEEVLENPEKWNLLIYPDDRERVLKGFMDAIKGGRVFHEEYRLKALDGRILFVIDHALPVCDVNGNVERVDGIIIDITDRKKLQEKLLQAEELKTLGEISARLAHEIRNPLTTIGGWARRLLKSTDEKDPDRQRIEIIVKEVERLEGILEMTLSYIEPFTLTLSQGDLKTLLMDVISEIEPEMRETGIGIEKKIQNGLPMISIDPQMLKKAISILFKDAFSRMVQGGKGTISLSISEEEEFVRIDIVYPVWGMSDDDIEQFFFPFVTANKGRAFIQDLPLAKVIIHKHGGIIDVEKEGKGELRIKILLPK